MTNVIRFPGPREHVVIDVWAVCKKGPPGTVGKRSYKVETVDRDGTRNWIWSGHVEAEALHVAAGLGLPIRNLSGGSSLWR